MTILDLEVLPPAAVPKDAAPAKAKHAKAELNLLQGEWKLVEMESAGVLDAGKGAAAPGVRSRHRHPC